MKEGGELGKIYSDNEVICREGEKGEVMYVIQSGKVRITKKVGPGEQNVATLQSGEIFGEMALFDKLPRSATVSAIGEARILSIDKNKLFTTISRDPTLVFKIIESMSRRIRVLNDSLVSLNKKQARISNNGSTIDTIYDLILTEVQAVIEADNGSIMILDENNVLAIKAAFGYEATEKMKFSKGDGIAGEVLRTGRLELVNHVSMDTRFISGPTPIESLLCAPLRFKEKCFGVINISNKAEKPFTLRDLKLLHSLSIYASIAIESARSFSEFQAMTKEALRQVALLA
jgi:CRP-like cAMP-binding protein